jgi:hypothetical protein
VQLVFALPVPREMFDAGENMCPMECRQLFLFLSYFWLGPLPLILGCGKQNWIFGTDQGPLEVTEPSAVVDQANVTNLLQSVLFQTCSRMIVAVV